MNMERSDTLTLLTDGDETYGLFEEIIQNSSFHDRLDSQDIRQILNSTEDQGDCSLSLGLWNNLDSDTQTVSEDNVKIEDLGKLSKGVPTKNVVQIGDSIYLLEGDKDDQVLVEERTGTPNVITPSLTVIDTSTASSPPALCSSLGVPSLSLQPWKGKYDFSIRVETATHSNSKWSFSTILKKLFLRPFDAVPIEVEVSPWIADSYINITPVYTSSQHTSFPVNRCHNHKNIDQEKKLPFFEHIVQVDNCDAKYRVDGLRHSVDIPLGTPAPGEATKLIYVKCGCWNTCTGGPSRKPFCLVFTLFDRVGQEIGRQILDLKVCACPVRDCGYSEKNVLSKKQPAGKSTKKAKPLAWKKFSNSCREMKRIKVETTEQNFEYISVPLEISAEVKKFINRIMAEKFAKENNFSPPFPEL